MLSFIVTIFKKYGDDGFTASFYNWHPNSDRAKTAINEIISKVKGNVDIFAANNCVFRQTLCNNHSVFVFLKHAFLLEMLWFS